MSHSIVVKDGDAEIMEVNVAGDLSALYEKLDGVRYSQTNAEGSVAVCRMVLTKIISELPQHPTSNEGIHIVQRCLAEMLEDYHDTQLFTFDLF